MDNSFVCGEVCVEGQRFELLACNPATKTPRYCSYCSNTIYEIAITLGVTQYVKAPCTLFADADIRPCTPIQACPSGQYWSSCTADRDGMCMPCTNTVCERGKFLSRCYPDRDTECLPCNASLACDASAGMYRTECQYSQVPCHHAHRHLCCAAHNNLTPFALQDHECRRCTTCKLGVSYEKQACTNETDRQCAPCTNMGACPPNTFKRSACNLQQDTVCYPCSR